jgi:hypothetical protein
MLKFYARHGRFPDSDGDLAAEVVEFVARQVQVPPEQMLGSESAGRTVEYYRAQIPLEIYSRIALADAQQAYDQAIGRYPV